MASQEVLNYLDKALCYKIDNMLSRYETDEALVHVKCVKRKSSPIGPDAQHYLFCFIKLNTYPNSLFVFHFDNQPDKYIVDNTTFCVAGTNTVPSATNVVCDVYEKNKWITMDDLVTHRSETPMPTFNQYTTNTILKGIFNEVIKSGGSGNDVSVNLVFDEMLSIAQIPHQISTGYMLIEYENSKFAKWHCWITDEYGIQLDLAENIMLHLVPDYVRICSASKMRLSDTVPEGYDRIDMDDDAQVEELEIKKELISICKTNQDIFWNTITKNPRYNLAKAEFGLMRNIRAKLLDAPIIKDPIVHMPIKNALRAWIGAKYDDNDYLIFQKMKEMNCAKIFFLCSVPGKVCLLGGPEYVNLENETVDKWYVHYLLEMTICLASKKKMTRKITEIMTEECDVILPFDDEMNVLSVTMAKN